MKKLKLAILKNEIPGEHMMWVEACKEKSDVIEWDEIEFTKSDWLDKIKAGGYDGLLAIPGTYTASSKNLYDERIKIVNSDCGIPVFPTLNELLIFENKRYLSYWLKAYNIPHPDTFIFYSKSEALEFLDKTIYPIVAKTSIGAAGSGVEIIKTKQEALDYVEQTFTGRGIRRRNGPKVGNKGFAKRFFKTIINPSALKVKLTKYMLIQSEAQKGFVLFQKYIPHDFEWRCVRIGDSFFAHKKLKVKDKASGSLLKGYETPPEELLNFIKDITDRCNFSSQAIDLFIGENGQYLVNEMQCLFG
ncbi:MAG: hypothetical protein HYR66_02960, partial [Sphingobacteriales bacterium]|nr:hypothetical protein [Sphingobacteriales bacterium]